jgi:AraC family transcriptional regulator
MHPSMLEPFKVAFNFSEPSDCAKTRRLCCDIFSAEHVQVAVRTPYDFAWCGPQFYLALHDIRKREGETCLDGSLPCHATDIRGKITFAPPDCSLSGWSHSARPINSLTVLFIKPELMAEEVGTRFRQENFSPMLYFEDESLRSSLSKIERLLRSEDPPDKLYAETLGLLVVMELRKFCASKALTGTPGSGGLSERQIRLVLDYIQSNLHQEISLSDLAALAGQSRFHFSRAFKKSLGVSPLRHVRTLRIEAARDLLKLGGTIAEVAGTVGFKGATQFTRAFLAMTSMTPSEYRRSL